MSKIENKEYVEAVALAGASTIAGTLGGVAVRTAITSRTAYAVYIAGGATLGATVGIFLAVGYLGYCAYKHLDEGELS